MVTQILDFGLPAPVDVQIDGADIERNHAVADQILSEVRKVPGVVDSRIEQTFDYPKFNITVDRTKAAQGGSSKPRNDGGSEKATDRNRDGEAGGHSPRSEYGSAPGRPS